MIMYLIEGEALLELFRGADMLSMGSVQFMGFGGDVDEAAATAKPRTNHEVCLEEECPRLDCSGVTWKAPYTIRQGRRRSE